MPSKAAANQTPLSYSSWSTPATSYPRVRAGNFRISNHKYSRGYYPMSGLKDSSIFQATNALTITVLQELRKGSWRTWMVDDPPHWEAMKFYAEQAHGHVLTTGLGLGLVVHSLEKNPQVESVTVIERSQDVIALVEPYVPKTKTVIVQTDFYRFLETAKQAYDTAYDTIIVDLWVSANLQEKLACLSEVIPLWEGLRTRFPNASIFFHGFSQFCDALWPMSKMTREGLELLARAEE